jgi:(2Fe-2S) ferredoxin
MSRALTVVLVRLEGSHYVPLEQSAANRLFSADALGGAAVDRLRPHELPLDQIVAPVT